MLRMLVLVVLVGMVSTGVANELQPDDREVGGSAGMRGFGRLIGVLVVIGAVLLTLLIIAGILSLFGVFEHDVIDPVV